MVQINTASTLGPYYMQSSLIMLFRYIRAVPPRRRCCAAAFVRHPEIKNKSSSRLRLYTTVAASCQLIACVCNVIIVTLAVLLRTRCISVTAVHCVHACSQTKCSSSIVLRCFSVEVHSGACASANIVSDLLGNRGSNTAIQENFSCISRISVTCSAVYICYCTCVNSIRDTFLTVPQCAIALMFSSCSFDEKFYRLSTLSL